MDTGGLLLAVIVTAASITDRDGGLRLLGRLREYFCNLELVWADSAYAGRLVTFVDRVLRLILCIVKRTDAHQFTVLPRRWVVERTLAWITRNRRLARDYERQPTHHEAMVYIAMTMLMTRRLAPR